ncbi:UDP-N-acetylmuramate dehydrogenase [Alkalispirillum mobile]|uniref:UDP-N-acetylenolpyruvoylglucosamine reductase n=1 Tax=Alkalispirillum mobile TaxID=85925 RepID=A0A498BX09_9GAMM|nr:UDP-N-acetylmuramate dehydrogenase [Alkalispirillum mobile]RLK46856.1 UDP-N-acetylmuramate dehydrogenase [Alkalispirillum mobile]
MMAAERRIQPGELRHWEPMARYTSWRAGGPAERLYRPAGRDDLVAFLQRLPEDEPLFWCGLGSNLLVREGGLRGTVILTQGGLDTLRVDGEQVYAEAGVACGRLSRYCIRQGLAGAEFFAGIPGTLGGALAMNAGAFGGETWSRVRRVETVDRRGTLRRRGPEDYQVGYRHVIGPEGEWFIAALLDLAPGDAVAMKARVKALLSQRNRTQPIGEPSCGSVFRNPPGDHAARLIEAAGLKGRRCGGAQVSERHANFIINTGGARPADIEALIDQVQAEVARQHGVTLVPEVHVVGERQS